MEQYIRKSALIAKIDNCIDRCNIKKRSCPANTQVEAICDNKIYAYKELLSFLDTLEVKEENDLENLFQALPEKIVDEKSHQVYELSIYHYDGQCVVDYVGEIDHDSLYTFGGNTLYEAIEKAWNWIRKNSTGG